MNRKRKKLVLVAMSGGVDSSVAAALLKQAGYEVIGVTMCFSAAGGSADGGNIQYQEFRKPSCCGVQGIEDARRVAQRLGIRHYVLNFAKELKEKVIRNFLQEYACGRTPNPCIRCNQYLKFDSLLKKALSLGCAYLATGHYARIVKKEGEYLLKKAKDKSKDQSYFVYRLNQNKLKHILMPLGNFTKQQVREIAQSLKLPVAAKPGSQEICFIPLDNYRQFLAQHLGDKITSGDIVDKQGNHLGRHKGICFYTIGQREGLGISRGYPLFVSNIDAKHNKLYVGKKEEVFGRNCIVKDTCFLVKLPQKKVELRVKIRYNHKEAPALVRQVAGRKYEVSFRQPQFAITPGQSAVFYDRDIVVGGGVIERAIK